MLITVFMNIGYTRNRFDGNLFEFDEHDIRRLTTDDRKSTSTDKVSKGEGRTASIQNVSLTSAQLDNKI